ncbi:MAG: adenosylcobinamide-phosphate synthase CbiB [Pseudomonadota bacterium]
MIGAVPLALLLDALIGDPDRVWRRLPHPVVWFGRLIHHLDATFNRGGGKTAKGALALAIAVAAWAIPAAALSVLCDALGVAGLALEVVVASVFLAHNSLHVHVRRVLDAPDITAARRALSMIVGRDTKDLDETAVNRANIETLSEGVCDGVVAPAFWFAVGGLGGLVAYKVVNTADSMIGHRTPRHEAFGFAAAKVDDLMNLAPARLTAVLTAIAAPGLWAKRERVVRDARRHVSPNAGWAEAAFAYALNVSLGGPRRYGSRAVDGVWLNQDGTPPRPDDVRRALSLSKRIGAVQIAAYGLVAATIALV